MQKNRKTIARTGSICLSAAIPALLVVLALTLVHVMSWAFRAEPAQALDTSGQATPSAASAATLKPSAMPVPGTLPVNVASMRDMILSAAHSGRIEDLQLAIDQNELPPEMGAEQGTELIAHLRRNSADGAGRETLALLHNLLHSDPALLPIGRDAENNGVYVWPAIAEADLSKLTPAQEVALYRLMPVSEAKAMIAAKKWTWWRLAIGADGTWLTFLKHN